MRFSKKVISFLIVNLLLTVNVLSQNDRISMQVNLDLATKSLQISQKIVYFNHSKDTLDYLYLHDWNNAFSDKNSALGKRLIENYKKSMFFTRKKSLGKTQINNVVVNYETTQWTRPKESFDFVKIDFSKSLFPGDSVLIDVNYIVKIPKDKFTSYGFHNKRFNLRYWHLVPVVYNGKWQLMHHLNMDDLQQAPTDYKVKIQVPSDCVIESNLNINKESNTTYLLTGKNYNDFQLLISPVEEFHTYVTDEIAVTTNIKSAKIENEVEKDILNRQLIFLKEKIGKFPHKKILISKTGYDKNPLYGMNQLPNFLRPFSKVFEWDLRMFKILSQEYIDNLLPPNTRQETWLRKGIHTYMMIQYINTYYPDSKLIGALSKRWWLKPYHISDLAFNDRFYLTYQYTASRNNDQALSTASDSLTNFNRIIFQPFKAGISLNYLNEYLGEQLVDRSIKEYVKKKKQTVEDFKQIIKNKTNKDVAWFFDDFIHSDGKVDYSIHRKNRTADSITLSIKNNRKLSVPISLYRISKDSIKRIGWFTDIDSTKTLSFKTKNAGFLFLNYKSIVPEINLRNNRVNTRWHFLKKPLKIRLYQDVEYPEFTQLFIEPQLGFNLYDGIIIAGVFKNITTLHKDFEYVITPAYSMRSKSLTGSAKAVLHKYLENKKINSYRMGIAGNYFHYQPNLAYQKLTPFAQLFFKRKNLRSVKSRYLSMNYTFVKKDIDQENIIPDTFYKYGVFNLEYNYRNPELINSFSYHTNLEIGKEMSRFSTDIRFRKLTNYKQYFSVRFFGGVFLNNQTDNDFFSFGVNRPNDYLFRYGYFGRDEKKGFFSQQIIINDGGFKSQIPVGFANQWMTSLNTSVSLWRWFEIYNDVGLIKNRDQKVYFAHDKGVRLNFINEIFEIYLPVHSNNGWEVTKPHYERRIRFVFKPYFSTIYNYLKRGFL